MFENVIESFMIPVAKRTNEILGYGYTCNVLLPMTMQFKEIVPLLLHIKLSVCSISRSGSATLFYRKILQTHYVARFAIFSE